MKKEKIVTVLGSVNLDYVAWADHLPQKGESVQGSRFSAYVGGKGANQAIQSAKLGADVRLIACIGDDQAGELIKTKLIEQGVDISHMRVARGESSGVCCIHVDEKGDNALVVSPQANMLINEKQIKKAEKDLAKSNVFITQLETNLDAVAKCLEIAKKNAVCTILNPAPAKKIPLEIYKLVDYVIPNETESEILTGVVRNGYKMDEWLDRVEDEFLARGVKNIIITLGRTGVYYTNGSSRELIPAFEVEAKDATAAGDAFIGCFGFCIASGMGMEESLKYACGAGAFAATKEGAQSSFGNLNEIYKLVKNNK